MTIKRLLIIIASFIVAFCLSIIPLPDWANWLRPTWLLITLMYWVYELPEYINLTTAWVIGLLMDVMYGSILGEHALAMTLVTYLFYRFQKQFRHFPIWLQSLTVVVYLYIYSSIVYIIQWSLGNVANNWRFWIAPLLCLLLWPIIIIGFRAKPKRFVMR